MFTGDIDYIDMSIKDPKALLRRLEKTGDLMKYKTAVWNDKTRRSVQRGLANKNSIFYDTDLCNKSWEEATAQLVKNVNNMKLHVLTRIRAYALLKAAELVDMETSPTLRDTYAIFATCSLEEIKYANKQKENLKLPTYKYKSSDARDLFLRHLPLLLVYGEHQAYIMRKGTVDWTQLAEKIKWPLRHEMVNKIVGERLGDFTREALQFATTAKDRHLIKTILAKLTSVHALSSGKLGMTFDDGGVKNAIHNTQVMLSRYEELKDAGVSNFKVEKQKKAMTMRISGSGRPYLIEKYPELTAIMFSLFDSTGCGFSQHPRLICDTLFIEQKDWMDIPRCVSIMMQVFGIDLSISAAYTYTQNYKKGSYQAKRHHDGKNINPNISLRRSTRDGQKKISVNSHYAKAGVRYSLEGMWHPDTGMVARDNKALVYTDVQIVQRPSKSWVRVQYEDHDWSKDPNRTLCLSTYQLIQRKVVVDDPELLSQLGHLNISSSRTSGPAVTLVKASYFQKEGAFRHFNELMYVISLDASYKHFSSTDGGLVYQLLLTVDGGGDERPRFGLTQFLLVTLRLLLDMDKLKTISYAEGDSKFHSVEGYHVAENRALSQHGAISSRAVFPAENQADGTFDPEKFQENMKHAAKDAAQRVHGTPYGNNRMSATVTPNESDWVVDMATGEKVRQFLKHDSTDHRWSNNFVIRPSGPVWDKLCSMYGISKSKALSATRIYGEMTDPECTWITHYGFSSYRKDSSWRGPPLHKFEITPILDVILLPEFHYLPYNKAKQMVETFFLDHDNKPLWLKVPDFFLPSKNMKFVMENNRDLFNDNTMLQELSNLIGVSTEEILDYVHSEEEKIELKAGRRNTLLSFSDNLGQLNCAQLRYILTKYEVKLSRDQHRKVDLLLALKGELEKRGVSVDEVLEEYH